MKVKLIYALLILNLLQFNQIRCQIDTLNGTSTENMGKTMIFLSKK